MSFLDVFLIFIGLLIAFWGYGFVRLAIALASSLWFSSLASLYVEGVLKGWTNALVSSLTGFFVFIVVFILAMINYRIVGSISLGFLTTYIIYKHLTLVWFFKPNLNGLNIALAFFIATSLIITLLTYMFFKVLIVLITSSLGTFLCYLGLTKLFPETFLALIVSIAVFMLSLVLNLKKTKLK